MDADQGHRRDLRPDHTDTWVSRAELAEIGFSAFSSKKKTDQVPGRLIVRRIPDLNPKQADGQESLFDTWRFHTFFTTSPASERDTVRADQVHRRHAIIENVHADLKAPATPPRVGGSRLRTAGLNSR